LSQIFSDFVLWAKWSCNTTDCCMSFKYLCQRNFFQILNVFRDLFRVLPILTPGGEFRGYICSHEFCETTMRLAVIRGRCSRIPIPSVLKTMKVGQPWRIHAWYNWCSLYSYSVLCVDNLLWFSTSIHCSSRMRLAGGENQARCWLVSSCTWYFII
jgi:hypothetical protein